MVVVAVPLDMLRSVRPPRRGVEVCPGRGGCRRVVEKRFGMWLSAEVAEQRPITCTLSRARYSAFSFHEFWVWLIRIGQQNSGMVNHFNRNVVVVVKE
jgi:hypothetical protein